MTEFADLDRLYTKLVEVFGADDTDTLFDLLQIPPGWPRPVRETATSGVDPWVRYHRLYERSVEVLGVEAADTLMALLRIPGWRTPTTNS